MRPLAPSPERGRRRSIVRNELARRLYDGELGSLPAVEGRPLGLEAVAAVFGLRERSSASRAVASARLAAAPVGVDGP